MVGLVGRVVVVLGGSLICVACFGTPDAVQAKRVLITQSVLRSDAAVRAGGGLSSGRFAGYVWKGPVTSVAASWVVPRAAGSLSGAAATWIGAQGPRPGVPEATIAGLAGNGFSASETSPVVPVVPQEPFVQVGIIEQHLQVRRGEPFWDSYGAFWTDTAEGDRPFSFMVVKPGDEVSVKLTVGRHRYTGSIFDLTTHRTARFSTNAEAGAVFNQADCLQENLSTSSSRCELESAKLQPTHLGMDVGGRQLPRSEPIAERLLHVGTCAAEPCWHPIPGNRRLRERGSLDVR
jgi:hypothetical protein